MAADAGRPSSNIRFKTLQAIRASDRRTCKLADELPSGGQKTLVDRVSLLDAREQPLLEAIDRDQLARDVYSVALEEVALDVLPVVRELEGGARRIRRLEQRVVTRLFEHHEHEPPDGRMRLQNEGTS